MPSPSPDDAVLRLAETARAVDGQPPFSDQSLIELRTGRRELLGDNGISAAIYRAGDPAEAEFVVAPDARGGGHGTALLESLIARTPAVLLVWAHGDHPAARALAASHGLTAVRELLQLRTSVPQPRADASQPERPQHPEHGAIGAFRPGVDDSAWLALNATAFAFHPEQGSVSQVDLDELVSEKWFRADDFLVLRDGDDLIGYCWLKIEGELGEFYVVGVDPRRQREGIGRRLMAAGFARLAERGIRTAALYVEADNLAAVALYRSLGFETFSTDIQYEFHTMPASS